MIPARAKQYPAAHKGALFQRFLLQVHVVEVKKSRGIECIQITDSSLE